MTQSDDTAPEPYSQSHIITLHVYPVELQSMVSPRAPFPFRADRQEEGGAAVARWIDEQGGLVTRGGAGRGGSKPAALVRGGEWGAGGDDPIGGSLFRPNDPRLGRKGLWSDPAFVDWSPYAATPGSHAFSRYQLSSYSAGHR